MGVFRSVSFSGWQLMPSSRRSIRRTNDQISRQLIGPGRSVLVEVCDHKKYLYRYHNVAFDGDGSVRKQMQLDWNTTILIVQLKYCQKDHSCAIVVTPTAKFMENAESPLFHRRTRTTYLYNRCLTLYNVLMTSRVYSSVKSQFRKVRQTK